MPELYVPASVLRERRLANEAKALEFIETARISAVCDEFDPLLQEIDPSLCMVFCPEPAPLEVVAAGARPGRYNIMRESFNGGPRSFLPLDGPDGGFVEPGSWIFDKLRASDLWNSRVVEDRRRALERLEDARRKREQEEERRLVEEGWERWQANTRTQVLMSPDVRWAQNSAGRKRRPK